MDGSASAVSQPAAAQWPAHALRRGPLGLVLVDDSSLLDYLWGVGARQGDDVVGAADAADAAVDAHGSGEGLLGAVPASDDAMAALPETTVGEAGAGKGECAVCFEGYAAGDTIRTLPCAHGFHDRCIFGWLRISRLCPLCRFALPAEADMDTDTEEEGEGETGEHDDGA